MYTLPVGGGVLTAALAEARAMPSQDFESLALLRGHHLRAIHPETQGILMRRLSGTPVTVIADALSRSSGSVRREIDRVQDAIFIPLCLERDQWATAFWVGAHLDCCRERWLGHVWWRFGWRVVLLAILSPPSRNHWSEL